MKEDQSIMKVSILIVNYNTETYIHSLLVSIINQSMIKKNFEIIISNNVQNTNLTQMIEKNSLDQKLNIKVLQMISNIGFGRAMNEAAKASRAEHLLIINPDVLLDDINYLDKMLDYLISNPNYGVATSRAFNDDGEYENDRYTYEFFDNLGYDDQVCWFQGSLLFIRRDVFKELGGFDKDYFMYCEDEDLCYRIKNKGYSLLKNHKLSFYHKGGASEPNQDYDYYYRHFKSMLLFMHKHKEERFFNEFIKELNKKNIKRVKRYVVLGKFSHKYRNRGLKAQVMHDITYKILENSAKYLYFDK